MSTIIQEHVDAPVDGIPPVPTDPVEPDPEDGALFSKVVYDDPQLQLPGIDGETTDKIAVKFSGTVFLDRSDAADCELMRSMKIGGNVTLMVEGRVAKKGWGFTSDRDGDLDVVKLEHAINVQTVYKPVTEQ